MEDFGDLLYIVFAIIGIVYSIIKKSGKKASESTQPINPVEDMEEPYEDDIPNFDQIFGKTEVPKPEVVNVPKEQPKADQSVEAKKRQLEDSMNRIKKTKEVIKEETVEVVEESPGFEFDLRKAVIYSEVLKRPEY